MLAEVYRKGHTVFGEIAHASIERVGLAHRRLLPISSLAAKGNG